MIDSAAGAYWAAGNLGGRPTIWRSTDLENFSFAYIDPWTPQPRWMRFNSVVEFDDKVVVSASGRTRNGAGIETERSFVLATDDDGATWTDVEDPLFSETFQRLDKLIVSSGSLLASVVNDECCGDLTSAPARTVDLETWEPLVLPNADGGSGASLVTDNQGNLWALATEGYDDTTHVIVWTSIDGGETWTRSTTAGSYGGAAAVAGAVVFMPSYGLSGDFSSAVAEPRPPLRFVDGQWTELDHDFGQWGDGDARLTGIVDPDTGRFYGKLRRQIRANPHYCFDDTDSCNHYESALVTSPDGLEWSDVVGGPEVDAWPSGLEHELFMTLDGRIAAWHRPSDDRGDWGPITIERWTGDPVPSTIDPPDYPPAEQPVPYFDFDEGLPIGTTRRYAWAIGGCGFMYIDDISWIPTTEPDTTGWPIKEVAVDDGPSAYAFGRVERIDEDLIEFTIEDTDTAVSLTPC